MKNINNNATLEELKELDTIKIKHHFYNGDKQYNNWYFDHGIENWFNKETKETIVEYLLNNVETTLSPYMFQELVEGILWTLYWEDIIEEMSNIDLLKAISSSHKVGDKYKVFVFGKWVKIVPLQYRRLEERATRKFIMGEE